MAAGRFATGLGLWAALALVSSTAFADPPPAGDAPPLAEPTAPGTPPPPLVGPEAPPPTELAEERWAKVGRIGAFGGLFVAEGLVAGGGFSLSRLVEVQAGLAFGKGSEQGSQTTTSTTVQASLAVDGKLPFVRARGWLGRRHAALFELGGGLGQYEVTRLGSGKNTSGTSTASITYNWRASSPMALFGGGYGFRTDIGFRVTVVLGWLQFLSASSSSTLVTTGAFTAADRAEMKADLDNDSSSLHKSRPYMEGSISWYF